MSDHPFVFTSQDGIGRLTLNRKESYNSFDSTMLDAFEAFLKERRHDTDTRVIILDGGEAKGFCAGLDTKNFLNEILNMEPMAAYEAQVRLSRLFLGMRQIPQPILACVHGAAAGIGFSLAMASDLRLITPDARFSAAYINIGLGGADMSSSYFLPRLIGAGRAYEFLLTGDWMDAQTAMDLGMASRMIPREELLPTAEQLARTMVEKNPMGLRMTKEALNVNLDCAGLEAALNLEDRNQIMVAYTYRMK
ncbi:MAG: enoyl-CoA hydratase/isomerase family protein [Desulfobacterales bacterium]|nr:enoyl-CoA hydratase/isomerase family protein [Desulfobacterales bacterium]